MVTISGISINDEAVNYAFAGDVAVIITGIDIPVNYFLGIFFLFLS